MDGPGSCGDQRAWGRMRLGRMQADSPAPAVPDAAIDTTSETRCFRRSGGVFDAAAGTPGLDGFSSADSGGANPMPLPMPPAARPDAPSLSALGAPCSAGSGCATGNCADGVCCDKPCSGCKPARTISPEKPMALVPSLASAGNPHRACADETATNRVAAMEPAMARVAAATPPLETACGDPSCTGSTLTTQCLRQHPHLCPDQHPLSPIHGL